MILKVQIEHLLRFMEQHPSLSNPSVLKGHTYFGLWQFLSDYLNYLALKNKKFIKSKEQWIELWEDLTLEVKRKVFAFTALSKQDELILDILTAKTIIPPYLLQPDEATVKSADQPVSDEYFYHDSNTTPLTKEKVMSLQPILKSTYLYGERIRKLLGIHPAYTIASILDLEKFDTDTVTSTSDLLSNHA